ncbi:non-heme iron oxygenase ferredoxin subunit [Nocardioides yefusunii]|uniref:Non-heme iron oxygenase ferredoxin subunit n=1 Tax=Nocardioides yefusunii TaxID=2500546 RepID=A0ABW1QU50_9ACTN|nr:non-heme iron oxygenase ferredoxin subunit [Nocardioides yefusunii]
MAFQRAAAVADFRDGAALSVTLDGVDVALAREAGEYYAIKDECSHAMVALSEGDVENCAIECWAHGATFDLRTGEPNCPPATEPVATFPVQVDGDDVLVDVTRTLNGVTP